MAFSDKLEAWYNDCGRTLPWRGIDDPYRIWLSEIILQQTRIEQGRDYWLRFVEAFPTVADLAAASEEQVLRLWQGLGYYSRARNLHAAAQYIMNECGGAFPDTYEGIRKLKGVGRYTAAAIASFAFRLPYPVIDGNVYRFISRLHGISTPIATDAAYTEFERLLLTLIDRRRPNRFNAALMDFGSLQCRPVPDCAMCPFADECVALSTGRVGMLPVKAPKSKPVDRWFYYFVLRWEAPDGPHTMMQRRTGNDIWRGLWQFPLLETDTELDEQQLLREAARFMQEHFQLTGLDFTVTPPCRHQLTHRTIHARFLSAEVAAQPSVSPVDTCAVAVREIKNMPLPRLIDRYLQEL
ncbi:MAG: A/G-specific adenine glycosylase [Bacteroidales bacterium]|nr:A/G-specific adenine glycosylase [Bacteroidales bacterium]